MMPFLKTKAGPGNEYLNCEGASNMSPDAVQIRRQNRNMYW